MDYIKLIPRSKRNLAKVIVDSGYMGLQIHPDPLLNNGSVATTLAFNIWDNNPKAKLMYRGDYKYCVFVDDTQYITFKTKIDYGEILKDSYAYRLRKFFSRLGCDKF